MAVADHLHTVAITGTEDAPKIKFTCHGGRDAECHQYPDCECETWEPGHEHPFAPHEECWMQSWFDNAAAGAVEPGPEFLADCGIEVGRCGPIKTRSRVPDYIEWEFTEEVGRG
ncbi:hypothetical protein IU414_06435 [Nocardia farcinica]|nr:hypothetical protein [Nocardia farcinica]MBF6584396.1 hypothetical protein [Nocardia farcinica]